MWTYDVLYTQLRFYILYEHILYWKDKYLLNSVWKWKVVLECFSLNSFPFKSFTYKEKKELKKNTPQIHDYNWFLFVLALIFKTSLILANTPTLIPIGPKSFKDNLKLSPSLVLVYKSHHWLDQPTRSTHLHPWCLCLLWGKTCVLLLKSIPPSLPDRITNQETELLRPEQCTVVSSFSQE